FTPSSAASDYVENLGLLGKMATTAALFEPFRNPVTVSEVRSCLSKLLDVTAELERRARRENIRCEEAELPKLWILTPTASETLLNGFNAVPDQQNWPRGIYFLGEYLRTAVVVIHQLPETEETLWLRILGRGRVQERAIAQLSALSVDHPVRAIALELLYRLQSNLATNQEQQLEAEDRELVMAIAPLFQQQLEAAEQRGVQQGIERGIQQGIQQGIERGIQRGREEGQRSILENFLRVRFGELDALLAVFLAPVSALPANEFTLLLLQFSALTGDEEGIEQARRLLAENVLRMRFSQLDERIPALVTNLLSLSPEELALLWQQLPQLSDDELLARLSN
ncbi:flagellar assembly protein H, partial [Microseira sp. BLCC-F43]|uniref:flagellar assembly protein H n=1 Tax=Microseira sp. BLCC-F43 TaxID=3153602 RepID=UPI0035B7AD2B